MAVVNASTLHETDRYRLKSAIQNFDLMFSLGIFSTANIIALSPSTPQALVTLIQTYMLNTVPLVSLDYVPNGRAAIEAIIELVQFGILGGTMSDTTLIAAHQTSYSDLRTAILGNLPTTDPSNFSTTTGVLANKFIGAETYSGNHRGLNANALPSGTLGS